MKLSIVIPCYNESDSLNTLINKCIEIIDKDIEIILVDNGSTDHTFQKLSNMNLPKNIILHTIPINKGYGNGILEGLKKAKGEILSWTHADLQTDPNDVVIGYEKYKSELTNKKIFIKGVRRNRKFFDNFFSIMMGLYCSLVLKSSLFDINAQPKIFHRVFFEKFINPPHDFSLDLYVYNYFKSNNIKVETIPVYFDKRLCGTAKGGGNLRGKIKLIIRTLNYIHKLKKSLNNEIHYS